MPSAVPQPLAADDCKDLGKGSQMSGWSGWWSLCTTYSRPLEVNFPYHSCYLRLSRTKSSAYIAIPRLCSPQKLTKCICRQCKPILCSCWTLGKVCLEGAHSHFLNLNSFHPLEQWNTSKYIKQLYPFVSSWIRTWRKLRQFGKVQPILASPGEAGCHLPTMGGSNPVSARETLWNYVHVVIAILKTVWFLRIEYGDLQMIHLCPCDVVRKSSQLPLKTSVSSKMKHPKCTSAVRKGSWQLHQARASRKATVHSELVDTVYQKMLSSVYILLLSTRAGFLANGLSAAFNNSSSVASVESCSTSKETPVTQRFYPSQGQGCLEPWDPSLLICGYPMFN